MFFKVMFSITAGRFFHISFKYFSIVTGIGKSHHFRCLCNIVFFSQKRKTLLDSVKKQIIEKSCLHVLFKKATAFTFADIYMLGDIFQCNRIAVVLVYEGKDFFESGKMVLICGACKRLGREISV